MAPTFTYLLLLSSIASLIASEPTPAPRALHLLLRTAAAAAAPLPDPTPSALRIPIADPIADLSLDDPGLTPDDVLLDTRNPGYNNGQYGGGNYGGSGCGSGGCGSGCGSGSCGSNCGSGGCGSNCGAGGCNGQQWQPTQHWAPTSRWAPQAVTVYRTQTYCPHCHPTSVWQPAPAPVQTVYKTTTYCPHCQPTSRWVTSYCQQCGAAGGVVTKTVVPQRITTYVQPTYVQTTPAAQGAGGYCSTLYAVGPGLPTTRQGECGTILVTNGGGVGRRRRGGTWLVGALVVVVGAVIL